MDTLRFADRLEVIGIVIGAFLVLTGIGTIAGQPWNTAGGALVTLATLVGAVMAIAIGAALAWLVSQSNTVA